MIVARVSGMSFADFSRTRIFQPLGLDHTQWRDDYLRIVPGRSSAYDLRDDGWFIDRPIENVHGNGGLLTTVGDLLRWNDALRLGRPERSAARPSWRRCTTVARSTTGVASATRRGWTSAALDGLPEVSHTGSTAGYRAFLAHYPEQKVGVAILCNAGNVSPGQVGERVARIVLDRPAAPTTASARSGDGAERPAPPKFDGAALRSIAGEYYSPDVETTLKVTVEDGELVLHRRPATRVKLVAVERDLFAAGPLGRIRLVRDRKGAVTHLSVQQSRVYDLRFDRMR